MANRRITELQDIAGTALAEDDLFTVVHVGEVDPTLKNRKLTLSGTKQYLDIYYLPRTGGTVSGAVVVQGDLTVSGNTNFTASAFTGVVTVGSLLAQSGIIASGTISGATITGANVQGTNVNGVLGNFTTLTGQTINVTSGNFLQKISGVTITGTTVSTTTGSFVSLTGTTVTFTSGIIASGTAALPSLAILSDPNTGLFSPGADQLAISTNGTEKLIVKSNGTVGLGTSTPSAKLDVEAANFVGGPAIGIRYNTSNPRLGFNVANSNGFVYIGSNTNNKVSSDTPTYDLTGTAASQLRLDGGQLIFNNAPSGTAGNDISFTNRLTITPGGLVGIGTSAPNYQLHVITDFAVGASGFNQQLSFTNDTIQSLILGTGYTPLKLNPLGGNVGIGTSSPGSALEINAAAATSPFIAKINTAEAARIDSSGRLLVGTSSTSASTNFLVTNGDAGKGVINIASTSATPADGQDLGYISFNDSAHIYNNAIIRAQRDGGTWTATTSKPTRLVFSTTADNEASPTERMRINRNGQISSYALAGAGSFNLVLSHGSAASSSIWMIAGAYGATAVNTGTTSFLVATNGNVTNTNNSYGAISDAKLKENIVDATPQWDDLKALQVRNYNFKEGQTHTQIGLVAQEVELVSPGLVTESPDRDEDGNDLGTVTKSVNYSVLYMKAVKALQEAMERIEVLEQRLTDARIA